MSLQQRPDPRQVVRVADHDRVRVADVDHDHVQLGDPLRLGDGHGPQLLLYVAVLDSRDGLASPDANADFAGSRSIGEPARGDARAVAGQLGRRAVRVPDDDVGFGVRGGDDLDDAVGVPTSARTRSGVSPGSSVSR